MSETLGSLIDKLSIVNVKLFTVQDVVHKAAQEGIGIDADTVKKVTSLNLQRNQLMFEIDTMVDRAVRDGRLDIDPHIKLT